MILGASGSIVELWYARQRGKQSKQKCYPSTEDLQKEIGIGLILVVTRAYVHEMRITNEVMEICLAEPEPLGGKNLTA